MEISTVIEDDVAYDTPTLALYVGDIGHHISHFEIMRCWLNWRNVVLF